MTYVNYWIELAAKKHPLDLPARLAFLRTKADRALIASNRADIEQAIRLIRNGGKT